MKRRHLKILNQVAVSHGIYKYGIPFGTTNEEEDDETQEFIRDYRHQRATFRDCHHEFEHQIRYRHEQRDSHLHLAHYDYIVIYSYKIIKTELLRQWGLVLISRTDWGLTMTAQIVNRQQFDQFMDSILEYAKDDNIINEVPEQYASLTIINKFLLLSSDQIIKIHEATLVTNIQLTRLDSEEKREIYSQLTEIVGQENIRKISEDLQLYEVSFESVNRMRYVVDNLDIIQQVQSIKTWHVSPSRFQMVNFNQELDIDMTGIEDLPVVGLIDTGVRDVPAINNLIVERTKLNENMTVQCGHGTNVASLILFGRQPLDGHLVPQARIYSIQVLETENGKISINALKQKIVEGIIKYRIKVFNISLSETVCKTINEGYSDYAKVLDEIAYLYDVLFVTATGNIGWEPQEYVPFPYSHYDPTDPNLTQMTNIGSPAENMNGITVGAVGTMDADLPTTYTRKSHIDYTIPINGAFAEKCMINFNLMKPDVLSEGGEDYNEGDMIDVIEGNRLEFIKKSIGTSLATPLITYLCARIIRNYPSLSAAAIKSLVINSAIPTGLYRLNEINQICASRNNIIINNPRVRQYHRLTSAKLCRMIEGRGVVPIDDIDAIASDDNIVTFVGEEEILDNEIKCVNLRLPQQLKAAENSHGKKLWVSMTLCFITQTSSGADVVNYNPYHISFRILRGSENINHVAEAASYNKNETHEIREEKKRSLQIKGDLNSWSDDPLPSYLRKFFSNTQQKRFYLNYTDIVRTNGIITLAFRCVTKPGFNATPISFSYTMKLELLDKSLIAGDFCLYDEIEQINHLDTVGDVEAVLDVEI